MEQWCGCEMGGSLLFQFCCQVLVGCCNTGPGAPTSLGTAAADGGRKSPCFLFLYFQFFSSNLSARAVCGLTDAEKQQLMAQLCCRDGLGTMHDPEKMRSGSASGSECPGQAESQEGSLHLPRPH